MLYVVHGTTKHHKGLHRTVHDCKGPPELLHRIRKDPYTVLVAS